MSHEASAPGRRPQLYPKPGQSHQCLQPGHLSLHVHITPACTMWQKRAVRKSLAFSSAWQPSLRRFCMCRLQQTTGKKASLYKVRAGGRHRESKHGNFSTFWPRSVALNFRFMSRPNFDASRRWQRVRGGLPSAAKAESAISTPSIPGIAPEGK